MTQFVNIAVVVCLGISNKIDLMLKDICDLHDTSIGAQKE